MTRQEANRELVRRLATLVEAYPDQRFVQLLFNADILKTKLQITPEAPYGIPYVVNEYNTESVQSLEFLKKSILYNRP